MPRSHSRKAWNRQLVAHFEAKAQEARSRGVQSCFQYSKAAGLIAAVGKDIWVTSTGVPKNLPKKLTDSMKEICRRVMTGDVSPGTPAARARTQAASTNTPLAPDWQIYLSRMKYRSGPYAIMMAFDGREHTQLTRQAIIRDGQEHCDEEMEPNWHAGRTHAAWSSIKTLENKGLVLRTDPRGFSSSSGRFWRATNYFQLTDAGRQFLAALKQRFSGTPAGGVYAPSPAPTAPLSNKRRTPATELPNQVARKALRDAYHSSPGVRLPARQMAGLKALERAGGVAGAGASAARRLNFGGAVASGTAAGSAEVAVELPPAPFYREGGGEGLWECPACLSTQVESCTECGGCPAATMTHMGAMYQVVMKVFARDVGELMQRHPGARVVEGAGDDEEMPAIEEDEEWVGIDEALQLSLAEAGGTGARKEAVVIDLSDEDGPRRTATPRRSRRQAAARAAEVIDIASPPDEDVVAEVHALRAAGQDVIEIKDVESPSIDLVAPSAEPSHDTLGSDPIVLEDSEDEDDVAVVPAGPARPSREQRPAPIMQLQVDTAERESNARARQILDGLEQNIEHVTQAASRAKRPGDMTVVELALSNLEVSRAKLAQGDFCWGVASGQGDSNEPTYNHTPFAVERKAIRDIVGRSAASSGPAHLPAHLEQLSRMDISGLPHGFLLLEGDPHVSGEFQIFGVPAPLADSVPGLVRSADDVYEVFTSLAARGSRVRVLRSTTPQTSCVSVVALSCFVAAWASSREGASSEYSYMGKRKADALRKTLRSSLGTAGFTEEQATITTARFGSVARLLEAAEMCEDGMAAVMVSELSGCSTRVAGDALARLGAAERTAPAGTGRGERRSSLSPGGGSSVRARLSQLQHRMSGTAPTRGAGTCAVGARTLFVHSASEILDVARDACKEIVVPGQAELPGEVAEPVESADRGLRLQVATPRGRSAALHVHVLPGKELLAAIRSVASELWNSTKEFDMLAVGQRAAERCRKRLPKDTSVCDGAIGTVLIVQSLDTATNAFRKEAPSGQWHKWLLEHLAHVIEVCCLSLMGAASDGAPSLFVLKARNRQETRKIVSATYRSMLREALVVHAAE
ncbi:unnamed protein product [Pedinophyceae sp. YPF-701]|nr:unnamed protein product [Pedinophyceae sp. YPF-701]